MIEKLIKKQQKNASNVFLIRSFTKENVCGKYGRKIIKKNSIYKKNEYQKYNKNVTQIEHIFGFFFNQFSFTFSTHFS